MTRDTHTSSSPSESRELRTKLSNIRQGDVVSLGAVSLVGVGPTKAWNSTAEHEGKDQKNPDGLWSLTIESDAGWYVIITQDCDIARDLAVEPCLVVCPIRFVTEEEWIKLRTGPGSPRQFPFPDNHPKIKREGKKAIADLRFVTSIDKSALLDESVDLAHPLTGPQRVRFSRWVGARYARVPHSDELENNVLPKAGKLIRDLGKKFAQNDKGDPAVRLVGIVNGWYLDGNDLRITFIGVTSEASAKRGGFWEKDDFHRDAIEAAVKTLTKKISSTLPDNSGYTCRVEVVSLDAVSAADYLSWSEWVLEKNPDPLQD